MFFTIFSFRTTAPAITIITSKLVYDEILTVKTVTPGLTLGPQEGFKDKQKSIEKMFEILFVRLLCKYPPIV